MVNQTQKKDKPSSAISEKSGVVHLPTSQETGEKLPTLSEFLESLMIKADQTGIETRNKKRDDEGLRLTCLVGLSLLPSSEVSGVLGKIEGKVTKTFHKFVSRFGNPSNDPAKVIRDLFTTPEYKTSLGDNTDDIMIRISHLESLKDPSDPKGKRNLAGVNALTKFAAPPSPELLLKRAAKARRDYLSLSEKDREQVDRMAADETVNEKGQTKETALDVSIKAAAEWSIISREGVKS